MNIFRCDHGKIEEPFISFSLHNNHLLIRETFFNKVEVSFIILLRKENYVFSINNFNSVQLHIEAKVNKLQTTIA